MNTKTLRRQTKFVPLDGSPTTLKAVKKGEVSAVTIILFLQYSYTIHSEKNKKYI